MLFYIVWFLFSDVMFLKLKFDTLSGLTVSRLQQQQTASVTIILYFFFIFRSLFRSYGFFVLFYCTHYVYYKVKMECRERFLKEATIRKISSSKTHIEPIDKEQKRQNNFRSSNFYAKDNF